MVERPLHRRKEKTKSGIYGWEEGVGRKSGALLSKSEDVGGTSIHSSRFSVLGRAASCRGEAEVSTN